MKPSRSAQRHSSRGFRLLHWPMQWSRASFVPRTARCCAAETWLLGASGSAGIPRKPSKIQMSPPFLTTDSSYCGTRYRYRTWSPCAWNARIWSPAGHRTTSAGCPPRRMQGFSTESSDCTRIVPNVCAPITTSECVTRVADAVFGGPYGVYGVTLVVSQPGEGRGMAMHRDPTWSSRSTGDPVFAVGLPIDPATVANGAVSFVPGTHLQAADPPSATIDDDGEIIVEVDPGDAVIHNLGVWHRSRRNVSALPRRVVYYAFMSYHESNTSGRSLIVMRTPVGWTRP